MRELLHWCCAGSECAVSARHCGPGRGRSTAVSSPLRPAGDPVGVPGVYCGCGGNSPALPGLAFPAPHNPTQPCRAGLKLGAQNNTANTLCGRVDRASLPTSYKHQFGGGRKAVVCCEQWRSVCAVVCCLQWCAACSGVLRAVVCCTSRVKGSVQPREGNYC